jgi:hypothetical protein
MARAFVNFDDRAILGSDDVRQATEDVARSITRTANKNTNAPAGFVWRWRDDVVNVSSRGAAAVPREVGTRMNPAGRPMKRALDAHEVR